MKTTQVLVSIIAGTVSAAFAASGVQSQETGVLVYFFIGFFALIVASQLVPATILFVGMLRGVLPHSEKSSACKD